MNFITSIKTCFKKYIDFNGRASRSEFWYFTLLLVFGYFGLLLIVNYWNDSNLFYELSDSLYNSINYLTSNQNSVGLSSTKSRMSTYFASLRDALLDIDPDVQQEREFRAESARYFFAFLFFQINY